MPLTTLGIVRPDLDQADPKAMKQYIELLEAAVTNRQVGESAIHPDRRAWTVERVIPWVSLGGMMLLWIFGAGGQYRDFQTLAERVKSVENRLELEQAKNDAAYARRDLYDLRLKTMDDKLDAIGVDVKALKDKR